MNKSNYILLIVLFVSTHSQVLAQKVEPDTDKTMAFEQGDFLINAGFSFGYFGEYGLGGRTIGLLPTTASLEYGLNDWLSIGPYLGYASWRYTSSINYSVQFISIGGRVSFHYLPWLVSVFETDLNAAKLDFYVSLLTGIEFARSPQDINLNSNRLVVGPILGFKYLLNRNTGLFFEAGRGNFGFATLGIGFRL